MQVLDALSVHIAFSCQPREMNHQTHVFQFSRGEVVDSCGER